MARGRKSGPSRLDLRKQADAAEAREKDEDEVADEDEGDDDEGDDEEPDAEEEAAGDADDDEDEKPKKKKAAAKPKAKKAAAPAKPKKSRVPKEVRMKAVWVVFDNSSKRIDTFPFSQKAEAEALLEKKIEEKKGTFYLNLVKEPLE